MMKLSKNDLKNIIEEEVDNVLNEGGVYRSDAGQDDPRHAEKTWPGRLVSPPASGGGVETPPISRLTPEMRLVGGLHDLVDAWRPRTPEGKKYQQDVEELLAKSRGE